MPRFRSSEVGNTGPVSEYRTPEEETLGGRRDPEEAREDAGLDPEKGEKPEGAPLKREERTTDEV